MSEDFTRRKLLTVGVGVLNAITAGMVAIPGVAYVLSPVLAKSSNRWVSVGAAPKNETSSPAVRKFRFRDTADYAAGDVRGRVFVSSYEGEPLVLSSVCTHMGCNIAFNEESGTFECPCHGGRFDREGRVIGGPPRKPLQRYETRSVGKNLEIRIS